MTQSLALVVIAAAVLVVYLIVGSSLALLGLVPEALHIVVAVVRRERHRDEQSSHYETRVEMSPHGALLRAQASKRGTLVITNDLVFAGEVADRCVSTVAREVVLA